ncbi:hypothetical protein EIP91_006464 [Steccherinum ochraceum]|uniref:Glutamyl-tRNA(Gln) amidotransferase subunit F, mitochondrial n=1 Tax=Steccherinum ochraceum TaxID=92696 RepID=A0A4R0RE08_9APHY|nr:hypothetical protein EIP91_006464 [Steccherinum ochraceum]
MPVSRIQAAFVSNLRTQRSSFGSILVLPRRFKSSLPPSAPTQADVHGIPLQPTWSVNDLLASYPRPSISPATLEKLHALSALIPPETGTPEHQKLTEELEDLVKLVEAVKLVDKDVFEGLSPTDVPDGRVWAEGAGIDLTTTSERPSSGEQVGGRALLKHAARTANGLYVVEADRRKGSAS